MLVDQDAQLRPQGTRGEHDTQQNSRRKKEPDLEDFAPTPAKKTYVVTRRRDGVSGGQAVNAVQPLRPR